MDVRPSADHFELDQQQPDGAPPEMSHRGALAIVIRRSGPHVIEATLIPTALFYCCLVFVGIGAAYLVALTWSYSAVTRRLVSGREVPPILFLSLVGITVRTLVAVASGSTFMYFLQPILGTLVMAGVFLASLVVGRPLIGRLAHEFWPITPEVTALPGVARLFRRLTMVWAGVNLATAATTFVLLLFLPVATFVAAKQASGLVITVGGIMLTVALSLRTARREGLVAPAPVRVLKVAV